ncbi:hypothetical protein MTR67_039517 [Solanum verrucosum]|uniref:Uncharacterized protein n=1 Tax=Solanum verrucosum TaxID=315347 RepID=A0AAF0UHD1_SOLVR|nr:hypothetical protein MTR67_039517 [Solanum verrucosum]
MDENLKVDGDVDPVLMEVPLSFLTLDKSKADVSEHKIDRGDAMVVPISSIPPQAGVSLVNLGSDALSAQVNSGDVAISSPVKSFVYL